MIIMAKKKDKEEPAFQIQEAVDALECPNMWKAGFRYYLENNPVKNQKEFDAAVKTYGELKL